MPLRQPRSSDGSSHDFALTAHETEPVEVVAGSGDQEQDKDKQVDDFDPKALSSAELIDPERMGRAHHVLAVLDSSR